MSGEEHYDGAGHPLQRLWGAVITRAIDDASGEFIHGSERTKLRERESARRWLLYDVRDFDQVCHLAGILPERVRDLARKVLSLGRARITRKKNKPSRVETSDLL